MNTGNDTEARRLTLLGILLQGLHVLFGITAVMGVLVSHMLIDRSKDSIYYSQLRWQIVTFWICAPLYLLAFYFYRSSGSFAPVVLVFLYSLYRIGTSIWYYHKRRAITRYI